MSTFTGLASSGEYFNQVLSLSTSPIGTFTSTNWVALKDLLMSVLTNPFFYCIIGIIIVLSILPTFED